MNEYLVRKEMNDEGEGPSFIILVLCILLVSIHRRLHDIMQVGLPLCSTANCSNSLLSSLFSLVPTVLHDVSWAELCCAFLDDAIHV